MPAVRNIFAPCAFLLVTIALVHCSNSDLIIGDDSPTLPSDDGGGNVDPSPLPDGSAPKDDAAPPPKDAGKDAKTDASPPGSSCDLPSTCIPSTDKCQALGPNNGKGCASANEKCCAQTCPTLSPPAPTFCDGGPTAPLYDSSGCIVGYGCAPMTCAAGGGACVALVPGACASNNVGDANKYSCGGGLGVMCCLP